MQKLFVFCFGIFLFGILLFMDADGESRVPDWVRNTALKWSDGEINDDKFINGIQFLINEGIIEISAESKASETTLPFVPNWIKDTAGWWGTKRISDNDFLNGIKWLIENGIMSIPMNQNTISCTGSADCIVGKVTKIIDGDTIDVDGIRIRLALTAAPELSAEFGIEAKEFTANLCPIGSPARVDEDDGQTGGSFGRIIGKVYCNDVLLNSALLEKGLAVIDTRFCAVSEFSSEDWAASNGCQ